MSKICKICKGIVDTGDESDMIEDGEYYCKYCRTVIILLNEYMPKSPDLLYGILTEYKDRILCQKQR